MESLKFLVFADFHYKKKMYASSVENLKTILKRASDENVNFCAHLGDFCNNYIGSPEIVSELLDNEYGLSVFGVYGNHELESLGNSMAYVTPLLSNRTDALVYGTQSTKIEDGGIGYYYFDKGDFRLIFLDTNYSVTPEGEYEHNRTASYGKPKENTSADSLGDKQISWLEAVLSNASELRKKCIVFSHASFSGIWNSSPDAEKVRELFKSANDKSEGTVLLAINGHYHTNHVAVVDGVCYFDCHTAINGWWQSERFYPYAEEDTENPKYTFDYVDYDASGNPTKNIKMPYSALSMGAQTLFFESPLSAIVTVSLDGKIKIEGSESKFAYGITKEMPECNLPKISNFEN